MRTSRAARAVGFLILTLVLVDGCGGHSPTGSDAGSSQTPSNFDFGFNSPRRASAFGDSITLGVVADGSVTPNNYPSDLQTMLKGLDPSWRVINRGVGGERTARGVSRFPGVLAADRPGFVLIMEGTNDADQHEDPEFIVANLQAMVGQARSNKTVPVVGTIPPNFRHDLIARTIIDETNTMIRTMAKSQNVVLAEIFNGMNDPNLFGGGPNVDVDPLHPNDTGYSVMAGIWFTAMRQAIPAPPPPPPPPAPSGGTTSTDGRLPKKR